MSAEAGLNVYLVGGAVRDQLLKLPVTERDWVVVGSTPEEMLARGFRPVGKDFPVFLHPHTQEEYALARTERSTGPGYGDFRFDTSPDVTLEDDLIRRDLTINAIAMDSEGELIDPFNGQADLQEGFLRHVSPAFAEDPVRILRVARFAARFGKWGFRVAHSTHKLMRHMVEQGMVDALVPERVWAETQKALGEANPENYFKVLRGCSALARVFPEIDRLYDQKEPSHQAALVPVAMQHLQRATSLSTEIAIRFAAVLHHLQPCKAVKDLASRLRLPNQVAELGLLACHYCAELAKAQNVDQRLKLIQLTDALRRRQRFNDLLSVCQAVDCLNETQAQQWLSQVELVAKVETAPLVQQGLQGKAFAQALFEARRKALQEHSQL